MIKLVSGNVILISNKARKDDNQKLSAMARWSSEPVQFDPMKISLDEEYVTLTPFKSEKRVPQSRFPQLG